VSFVQNLSQPLYSRRPTVPLPEGLQVSPQMHGAAIDVIGGETRVAGSVQDSSGAALPGTEIRAFGSNGELVGTAYSDDEGRFSLPVPSGSYRISANLAGFAPREYRDVSVASGRTRQLDFSLWVESVSESVAVEAEPQQFMAADAMRLRKGAGPAAAPPPSAPISQTLRQARMETAQTAALGDQFEYRLPHPVTIGRNRSALLPIVQTEISGEKVTVYNPGSGDPRPRLAVSLMNETGLTLDAGSFTVLEGDAFAGEGLTDVIRPGEKRILSYGLDLHLDVVRSRDGAGERVTKVVIAQGLMRRTVQLQRKTTYGVRNQDGHTRAVLIEHPVEVGWTLVETPAPVETTTGEYRFRLEAAPSATTELVVQEESIQEMSHALSNVTDSQIGFWLVERSIDPDVERALRQVVAKRDELNSVQRSMQALDTEQTNFFSDQARLRENLGKLGNSSEEKGLRRRYVSELERQENRLDAIRSERSKLEVEREKLQSELSRLVADLAFEKTL
jgi:hypothetical protein